MAINQLSKEEIHSFEMSICEDFRAKKIRAPIHCQDNNIGQIINIFQDVKEEDFIVGSWRFHAECLCKGVPPNVLRKAIHEGRSISLCFKEYNVVSSAIVGANLSIGLGLAFDMKRKNENRKTWVFLGETTSTLGAFWESYNYARNWDLPIVFVISDNGKSVCTNTRAVWNTSKLPFEKEVEPGEVYKSKHLYYYRYTLDFPHAGPGGARIQF